MDGTSATGSINVNAPIQNIIDKDRNARRKKERRRMQRRRQILQQTIGQTAAKSNEEKEESNRAREEELQAEERNAQRMKEETLEAERRQYGTSKRETVADALRKKGKKEYRIREEEILLVGWQHFRLGTSIDKTVLARKISKCFGVPRTAKSIRHKVFSLKSRKWHRAQHVREVLSWGKNRPLVKLYLRVLEEEIPIWKSPSKSRESERSEQFEALLKQAYKEEKMELPATDAIEVARWGHRRSQWPVTKLASTKEFVNKSEVELPDGRGTGRFICRHCTRVVPDDVLLHLDQQSQLVRCLDCYYYVKAWYGTRVDWLNKEIEVPYPKFAWRFHDLPNWVAIGNRNAVMAADI